MTTNTEAWKARRPERADATVRAAQAKNDRSRALGPTDLFEALSVVRHPRGRNKPPDHVGARFARQALAAHLGFEPRLGDVVRLVEESFPDQVQAVRAREAEEAREAERKRKELARAEKAKAAERAEQEKLRNAVEAARQRRQESYEAELQREGREMLAREAAAAAAE